MKASSLLLRCSRQPSFPAIRGATYLPRTSLRHATTTTTTTTAGDGDSDPNNSPSTMMRLTSAQKDYLSSAIRVNQAGELAAVLICLAQTPLVVRSHPSLRPLLKHMHEQECGHLATFTALMRKHRLRPSALYPVWEVAASVLGWSTGAMGREATMACTEAVETEIGIHYNEQITTLLDWFAEAQEKGQQLDPELVDLLGVLKRTRDEELEHLDHAVENDAKEAKPYDPLVGVIRLGCRAAINIIEKV